MLALNVKKSHCFQRFTSNQETTTACARCAITSALRLGLLAQGRAGGIVSGGALSVAHLAERRRGRIVGRGGIVYHRT